MADRIPFVPYPPIERHGVIGDRRTAALVAADGTIDWLCLPDYDAPPVFGALLDAERGGFWRLGPALPAIGEQRYLDDAMLLVTTWSSPEGELELTDAMPLPHDVRSPEDEPRRIVLRRLRCARGELPCQLLFRPRHGFDAAGPARLTPDGLRAQAGDVVLRLWLDRPLEIDADGGRLAFALREDEELWALLVADDVEGEWGAERARALLDDTRRYWSDWIGTLSYRGPRKAQIQRSAMLVHLLAYAPAGSLVAAPTTSLPERIGAGRNYDYRYAWVRDASLSIAMLALPGDTDAARRYLDWLVGLDSATQSPLQVVYRIDGSTELPEHERRDLAGYRGSLPVRIGNRAHRQLQLDSLGYFADCALVYLDQGGEWRDAYSELIERIAEFTVGNWRRADHGIWELAEEAHYVSSRVMSWVALERAAAIAERVGRREHVDRWRAVMDEIHAEVMEQGWSERRGAFRQRYGSDALDASALLIPVMRFLPADHPRVRSTVERIAETLAIGGMVHRFDPAELSETESLPIGQFEGAFWPCTFWLATAYAMQGRADDAEAILDQADAWVGALGLFAEEVDARSGASLGNYPLLFSQVEYMRAVVALAKARPLTAAQLMVGRLEEKLGRIVGR